MLEKISFHAKQFPTISASTAKLVDIPVVNEVAKGTKKENYKSLHGCDGPFV